MANIETELDHLQNETYGKDMREWIIRTFKKVNSDAEKLSIVEETSQNKCLTEGVLYKCQPSNHASYSFLILPANNFDNTIWQFRIGAHFLSDGRTLTDNTAYRIYDKTTEQFSEWMPLSSSASEELIRQIVDEYLEGHPPDLTFAEIKANKVSDLGDISSISEDDTTKYPNLNLIKTVYDKTKVINVGLIQDKALHEIIVNQSDVIYYVPPGEYETLPILIENSNNITILAGGATINLIGTRSIGTDDGLTELARLFQFKNCSNVRIEGGIFDGGSSRSTPVSSKGGLTFNDVSDLTIRGVEVRNVGTVETENSTGILLNGNCVHGLIENVTVHDIQSGAVTVTSSTTQKGYIFSSGIKLQKNSSNYYPRHFNIISPVVYNIGFINGNNHVTPVPSNSTDSQGRTDGDAIFIDCAPSSYEDRPYTNIAIRGAHVYNCSKRALKIKALGVSITDSYFDVSTWSTGIEFQYTDRNVFKNNYAKNTMSSVLGVTGCNGRITIEDTNIVGGDENSENFQNGIVFGVAFGVYASQGNYTIENANIENIYLENTNTPILLDDEGLGEHVNTLSLKFKNISVKNFNSEGIIVFHSRRVKSLHSLDVSDIKIIPLTDSLEDYSYFDGIKDSQTFIAPICFIKDSGFSSLDIINDVKIMHPLVDSIGFYNYYNLQNFTAPYKCFGNLGMPGDAYTEIYNMLKLTDGEYQIGSTGSVISVLDGKMFIPNLDSSALSATVYIYIPLVNAIPISSFDLYSFGITYDYVNSDVQIGLTSRDGASVETPSQTLIVPNSQNLKKAINVIGLDLELSNQYFNQVRVRFNEASTISESGINLEFSNLIPQLKGQNAILNRLKAIEDQLTGLETVLSSV